MAFLIYGSSCKHQKNSFQVLKRTISIGVVLIVILLSFPTKTWAIKKIWSEDFNNGKLSKDWKFVALNDSSGSWFITDQPFPGSFGRNYQAPPIASVSRGFHLQYAPGVLVGKNEALWKKKELAPDAYIQTPYIDCSAHNSVVLKFQQNFFWAQRKNYTGGGLFVEVSNNGKDWMRFDVRNGVSPKSDCPNPMDVELNITQVAARQKSVFIRFWWHQLYQWYWMIDDVQLTESFDTDLQTLDIVSHRRESNVFKANDTLAFSVVNLSAKPLVKNVEAFLQIDKRPLLKTVIQADKYHPVGIIDTVVVKFPGLNLTDLGVHKIKFYTSATDDLRRTNDTLTTELYSKACEIGNITAFAQQGNEYSIDCNQQKFKIQFIRNDIFRIWMAYDGEFLNPAANDLIIKNLFNDKVQTSYSDRGDYYLLNTPEIALRAYKSPLRFALYKADNTTLVWEESRGITYGKETIQYLKRGDNEQFMGGGMQNGRYMHRDKTIKLTIDYNWEDGGNPNPETFYMSTNGYGAVRNTYSPGRYSFNDTIRTIHQESRFDCYYFVDNSLKKIIEDYTDLTGKPFLMPRWALSMGDANCYNRGAKSGQTTGSTATGFAGLTPSVVPLIADKYIENNMPRGWILPNDGYGCGCTDLGNVVKDLKSRGFHTGLWTENGVKKIAQDVGVNGSRLCKLDVAWVGPGYKFAMDGARTAYDGIEKNCEERGFVWTVCGWTGIHRNAVVWTGDQSGSWRYIRWHIPTLIGSGLSGQNCATGDVDGIFGGSDSTYVRDLQWKCFTPVFMAMSGWATNNKNGIKDKQPWLFGEPYTSINRKYLMLKQRLTPYMYTLCNEAYQTGVPAVRGMFLEYPEDQYTYTDHVKYQYMLGKDILVAPVFKSENKRDSIYLPAGGWFDFWDGKQYQGSTTLMNYSAPLDKLPLFVRAGAIIPMYQQMMYDAQKSADTLTLKVYPHGFSSFEMYEDDGLTREHRNGAFTLTRFEVKDSEPGNTTLSVVINATKGDFKGRLKQRNYLIDVHKPGKIKSVKINKKTLKQVVRHQKFVDGTQVWWYDPEDQFGILHINTGILNTDISSEISISYR